jgi:hypothetical protein
MVSGQRSLADLSKRSEPELWGALDQGHNGLTVVGFLRCNVHTTDLGKSHQSESDAGGSAGGAG